MGGVFALLIVIAAIAYMVFVQIEARKQVNVPTTLGKIAVQQIIDDVFGGSWKRVSGPGEINLQPKMRAHVPTISVSVTPLASGGTEVGMWMSHWRTRYGIAAHAQLVWRKKRQLAARLQQVGGVTVPGSMAGTQPGGMPGRVGIGMPLASSTPPTAPSRASSSGSAPVSSASAAAAAAAKAAAAANLGPIGQLLASSEETIVVRTPRSPQEIANVLRRSVDGVLPGSDTHFVVGPTRATFWAHVTEGAGGQRFLTLSLVTSGADRANVAEIEQKVAGVIAPGLDGDITVLRGVGQDPQLERMLASSTVVNVHHLT